MVHDGSPDDEATADVTVMAGERRYRAHRALLAARSPVLRAALARAEERACSNSVASESYTVTDDEAEGETGGCRHNCAKFNLWLLEKEILAEKAIYKAPTFLSHLMHK